MRETTVPLALVASLLSSVALGDTPNMFDPDDMSSAAIWVGIAACEKAIPAQTRKEIGDNASWDYCACSVDLIRHLFKRTQPSEAEQSAALAARENQASVRKCVERARRTYPLEGKSAKSAPSGAQKTDAPPLARRLSRTEWFSMYCGSSGARWPTGYLTSTQVADALGPPESSSDAYVSGCLEPKTWTYRLDNEKGVEVLFCRPELAGRPVWQQLSEDKRPQNPMTLNTCWSEGKRFPFVFDPERD